MNEKNKLRIRHILDAIATIEAYSNDATLEDFRTNRMLFDSITKQLIVIGEAVNHLSEEFQEEHHEIPFHLIVGMRNRLIHEYMLVNEETVWKTCTEDIPKLKKTIEALL